MQVVIELIKAAGESQSALVLVLLLLAGSLLALAYVARMFVAELRGSIAGHRSDMAGMLGEMIKEYRVQSAEINAQTMANSQAVLAANEGVRACSEAITVAVAILQRESRHHPATVLASLDGLHPKVDDIMNFVRSSDARLTGIAGDVATIREELARMERENLTIGIRQLRGGLGG